MIAGAEAIAAAAAIACRTFRISRIYPSKVGGSASPPPFSLLASRLLLLLFLPSLVMHLPPTLLPAKLPTLFMTNALDTFVALLKTVLPLRAMVVPFRLRLLKLVMLESILLVESTRCRIGSLLLVLYFFTLLLLLLLSLLLLVVVMVLRLYLSTNPFSCIPLPSLPPIFPPPPSPPAACTANCLSRPTKFPNSFPWWCCCLTNVSAICSTRSPTVLLLPKKMYPPNPRTLISLPRNACKANVSS
mmetsp:Transcript_1084/g.1583  ORF Transcript_1084/g.1583 Transcript_1084/m.1583 type:complete len:245 (-) Transcript_1084:1753-2487(-)